MAFLLLIFLPSTYGAICAHKYLSDVERTAFLNVHNNLRSQIAKGNYVAKGVRKPPAANMQAMKWGCALEASAKAYVDKCPNGHSNISGLGENLYWAWNTAPIALAGMGKTASTSWASEFQQFGWGNIVFNGGFIGHATQMSWATTNRVGCAVKKCPTTKKKFPYQVNVVCHYRAPGNMGGAPVYKKGPTCSQCPSGTTCNKNTGLCIWTKPSPAKPAPKNTKPAAPAPKLVPKTAPKTKLAPVVNKPAAPASTCPKGSLPQAERNAIVNAHFTLRSQIARGVFKAKGVQKPAATNMQALVWDCALEASAQAYVNKCPMGHSNISGLGENLYWSWSTAPIKIAGMGKAASTSWADEFQKYGWNGINYNGGFIGHATQMAWATTNKIGCAIKQCPSTKQKDGYKHQINVVCQYTAPGNLGGAPVYAKGATCSQCPAGTTCNKATGLCKASGAAPIAPKTTKKPVVIAPVPKVTKKPIVIAPVPKITKKPVVIAPVPKQTQKPLPVLPVVGPKNGGPVVAPVPKQNPNPSGGACRNSLLPDAEKTIFLELHNNLRSQLAKGIYVAKGEKKPAAANMEAMVWDCDLAASAQAFIETCPNNHSFTAGQGENLYWSWSTQPISIGGMGKAASSSWADEFQKYGWVGINYDGGFIGHATQMAWATSNRIGCAVKQCPSTKVDKGFNHQVSVVCQYKAQGNMRGAAAYKQGNTCSQCPAGTTCDKNSGLCIGGGSTAPQTKPVVFAPVPQPAPVAPVAPVAPTNPSGPVISPVPQEYSASAKCSNSKLDDGEKATFIKLHNDLRSQIAKGTYVAKGSKKLPATNMDELKWDCDLEASAQAYVEKCPMGHSNISGLGENLYWSWNGAPIPLEGMASDSSTSWADEFQQFGWDSIVYTGGYIAHATQMSWATTNKFGCATKQCPSSKPAYKYQVNVVCHYKEQGNMWEEAAYKEGDTCSQCLSAVCNKNTGLCVPL